MEEQLNYVTVNFRTQEKPNEVEIIYAEVKTGTEEQAWDTNPVIQGGENEAPSRYGPCGPVAAGLGVVCVVLVSVTIALGVQLQSREGVDSAEPDLRGKMDELSRELDRLNWTLSVILQYDNFSVKTHCPQKVCKPCLDGWVPFQSNCYRFSKSNYSSNWKTWQESRDDCRAMKSDLVVIGSEEEQEFINNRTQYYHDNRHGYWIGLSGSSGEWTWVDGSRLILRFWKATDGSSTSCALSLPRSQPLASWIKRSCFMKNRWICESRALIKPS